MRHNLVPAISVIAQAHFRAADITLRCTARPTAASILSTASMPCRSTSRFKVAPQSCDVALRRGAEQLFILTAKI